MRLTELAAYAGMTKQSMGELVDKMEAVGYVERARDPTDRRATRIRFTRKGLKVARATRALVLDVEAEWAESIGRRRLESLREMLVALLERQGPVKPGRSWITEHERATGRASRSLI